MWEREKLYRLLFQNRWSTSHWCIKIIVFYWTSTSYSAVGIQLSSKASVPSASCNIYLSYYFREAMWTCVFPSRSLNAFINEGSRILMFFENSYIINQEFYLLKLGVSDRTFHFVIIYRMKLSGQVFKWPIHSSPFI